MRKFLCIALAMATVLGARFKKFESQIVKVGGGTRAGHHLRQRIWALELRQAAEVAETGVIE